MKLTGKNRRKQNKDVMFGKKTFSKLLQNFFSHVQEFDEPTKIKSKVHAFGLGRGFGREIYRILQEKYKSCIILKSFFV